MPRPQCLWPALRWDAQRRWPWKVPHRGDPGQQLPLCPGVPAAQPVARQAATARLPHAKGEGLGPELLSCWAPCPLSKGSLPECQGLGVAATPTQLQIGIMKSKLLQCCKHGENKGLKLSLMSLDWLLPERSSSFLLPSLSVQANSHRNCTEPWNGMD